MRFIVSILLTTLLCLETDAALSFSDPKAFPDLGLEMCTFADATPFAVSMPRAESFQITGSDGVRRLEDRYDTFDLWLARTIRCRWRDAAGNVLIVARLCALPPDDPPGTLSTRVGFEKRMKDSAIDPRIDMSRDMAVIACAPVDVAESPVRPRRGRRRGLEELLYYPSTNELASVWAFKPSQVERGMKTDWYMAALLLASRENQDSELARFDAFFLDRIRALPVSQTATADNTSGRPRKSRKHKMPEPGEGDLLKRDYRRSVVNYDVWHAVESGDVVVVDDLPLQKHSAFVGALTNELPKMRRAYAAVVPSPLVASTNIAAVRVFSEREDYISYVGKGAEWSAAVWVPLKRELVLNLPVTGTDDLLGMVRHEAFHQYLSYAGMMALASPWFNEGHAELFEHTSFDRKGNIVFGKDPTAAAWIHANVDTVGDSLSAFLYMDYPEFYSGTDIQRRINYWIAWSIAYFLEVGAPEVRFRPFETLRGDYMSELVRSRVGDTATTAVFPPDQLKLFISEWRRFWKK